MAGADTREQAAILAIAAATKPPWFLVSRAVEQPGSALALVTGERSGFEDPDALDEIDVSAVTVDDVDRFEELIHDVRGDADVSLVTVLDDDYPANLQLVHDRPPFLFFRGELRSVSARQMVERSSPVSRWIVVIDGKQEPPLRSMCVLNTRATRRALGPRSDVTIIVRHLMTGEGSWVTRAPRTSGRSAPVAPGCYARGVWIGGGRGGRDGPFRRSWEPPRSR